MQIAEIRLECLKLATRPGMSPSEIIQTARLYLEWVSGQIPTTPTLGPGDSPKVGKSGPVKADKPSAIAVNRSI